LSTSLQLSFFFDLAVVFVVVVIVVIIVHNGNLSTQYREHGPAKLRIQTEAVPKLGEGLVPYPSVCLLHTPPLPVLVVPAPAPTPHPKRFWSIASPVVAVVVPGGGALVALFFVILLQQVGNAAQAHHAQMYPVMPVAPLSDAQ
jgi:hypothetical protein